mmetsp:Transcript_968/g.1998  ORF Transcript_968/g.1998 Transcript_968/m.1998 type:complete len:94 (-) Transcript_968:162-443(-)
MRSSSREGETVDLPTGLPFIFKRPRGPEQDCPGWGLAARAQSRTALGGVWRPASQPCTYPNSRHLPCGVVLIPAQCAEVFSAVAAYGGVVQES